MASDKVMKYVEGQLSKDPKVSNATLYEGAKKLDRAIGKLSIRQFHAKYPLQVKRRKGRSRRRKATVPRKPATRGRRSGAGGNADAVRKILFQFARDLSAADSQLGTVEVLSKVDGYTSDILKVAAR